jgi:hypothetical protein
VLENRQLIVLLERLWLNCVAQGLRAQSNHIFWGSLHVNSHEFWAILNSANYNLSFQSLTEWKLNNFWRELISGNQFTLDIFLVVHQELDHANFDGRSFWLIDTFLVISFNSHICVSNNALSNNLLEILTGIELIAVEVSGWVNLWVVVFHVLIVTNMEFENRHLSFGKSSGFTNTDIMEHCTSLNTLKVLDKNLVLLKTID